MDVTPAKKPRKSRKGYYERHPGGVLTRRPHGGARNTKPRAVHLKHASKAKLDSLRLDRRTLAGRLYLATVKDLSAHVGGQPTAAQALIIDACAKLKLSADLAWTSVMAEGKLDKESHAFNHFITSISNLRQSLNMLGLERKAKTVTLQAYLEAEGKNRGNGSVTLVSPSQDPA